MAKKLIAPVENYSPLSRSTALIDSVLSPTPVALAARQAAPPAGAPQPQAPERPAPSQARTRVEPIAPIHAGPTRTAQKKINIRPEEFFDLDQLALMISQSCGTRVAVNNLLRGAVLVLLDCKDRIVDQAGRQNMRRPHNHNPRALEEFELEIAKMIARSAARSRLSVIDD